MQFLAFLIVLPTKHSHNFTNLVFYENFALLCTNGTKSVVWLVDDRRKKKGDKKDKKKRKAPEVEDCSVGVFNTKNLKEGSKPKLNVFLKKSGNSKQTAINGEVSCGKF